MVASLCQLCQANPFVLQVQGNLCWVLQNITWLGWRLLSECWSLEHPVRSIPLIVEDVFYGTQFAYSGCSLNRLNCRNRFNYFMRQSRNGCRIMLRFVNSWLIDFLLNLLFLLPWFLKSYWWIFINLWRIYDCHDSLRVDSPYFFLFFKFVSIWVRIWTWIKFIFLVIFIKLFGSHDSFLLNFTLLDVINLLARINGNGFQNIRGISIHLAGLKGLRLFLLIFVAAVKWALNCQHIDSSRGIEHEGSCRIFLPSVDSECTIW